MNGHEFYNPYHFVPAQGKAAGSVSTADFLDLQQHPEGQELAAATRHLSHDRYLAGQAFADGQQYFSGRLLCKLTTVQPLVIGSQQTPQVGEYSDVEPFLLDGHPALPASSLRGLISSLVEAASDSAMRVLANEPYSYRSSMAQSRGAIGMIVEKPVDGRLVRFVRPLTFPPHRLQIPARRGEEVEVQGEFQRLADQLVLPAYLDRYDWPRNRDDARAMTRYGFLARHGVNSFSSAHRQDFWELSTAGSAGTILRRDAGRRKWFLQVDESVVRVKATSSRRQGQNVLTGRTLIGVLPDPRNGAPERLEEDRVAAATNRGILRMLGVTPERESAMPHTKKHELFIPVPDLDYFLHGRVDADGFDYDLPADAAIAQFEFIADQRTEDGVIQPFELAGQDRSGPEVEKKGVKGRKVRLAAGDLVHFRLKAGASVPEIESLAISAIWREDAGWAYDYFEALNPELIPFRQGQRTSVSTAEQLFGFVPEAVRNHDRPRQPEHDAETANLAASVNIRGLASRLRFGHGIYCKTLSGERGEPIEKNSQGEFVKVPLKILGSPKPPCPNTYFRKRETSPGESGYVAKTKQDLNPQAAVPQGRKFYLHHPVGNEPWRTRQDGNDARKDLKLQVSPIRPNVSFVFHIDFENLTETELAWLCYAVRPFDGFQHKLGLGKPLGLGSVQITPLGLFRIDRHERYAEPDVFAAPRYHHIAWWGEPQERLLLPDVYRQEKHGAASEVSFDDLVRAAQPSAEIAQALQHLGTALPPGAPPVHYPTVREDTSPHGPENDHFEWFVANADRHGPHEYLHPLEEGLRPLPRLPRPKKKG